MRAVAMMLMGFTMCAAAAVMAAPAKVAREPIDPETRREVQIDLPASQHLKNLTGKNKQGCCVWASGDMAARWHNFAPMIGVLQDRLGGGYPQLVDTTIARRAPGFRAYAQAEGVRSVELIDWAMRTGRLPCVTYGWSERMGSGSHMVILLHMDPATVSTPRACVMDNNYPGTWEWMARDEFIRRHKMRGPWSWAFLLPPPPPVPVLKG